ncbi:MAG: metallophosphoesterase family protein [Planctomycetaceae bacterium]
MKLLLFSDLHRSTDSANALVKAAKAVDVVIGAGDFANRHEGIHDTLDILCEITKPAVLVAGNGETFEELRDAAADWKSARVLHGSGCEIDGVSFWGLGGGIPVTPFGPWSYDFTEEQAEKMLAGCPESAVLVVHSPPYQTVDHDSSGRIHGSKAIRHLVDTRQPKLVACGHIHSDWGKQMNVGVTRIVNAGPAGVVVEID